MKDKNSTTAPPKPLTAISAALGDKDIDKALWALTKLYLHEMSTTPQGPEMKTALRDFSRLLLEIKKGIPASASEVENIKEELKDWISNG